MKMKLIRLLPLLLVLNGCYTLLLDPMRVREVPQNDTKIYQHYERFETLPIVRDNSQLQFQYPYANMHNGYYYNNPYTYTQYNPYGIYITPQHNVYKETNRQNKVPPVQPIKVDPAILAEKKIFQKLVWERRINPRARKAPMPTRREKEKP